ncbi:glycosyltransferase family 2 protein [Tamlana sp. 2201CG12-4]|uniref:glycosyltransferase family 2 protein n=1 Tax=Tamlana sp. 2201CG12-4 TaxID=3112582 RepID=UPI002DBB3573|nr:glycosyltransferase family 2 protein [Tamlana sp. 2201CG12-4]MEC3906299.1 glycosyltransferase family 2 protein [Tamlana sp. 2201CG12-4]
MNKALTILIPVFNELFFTKQCLNNLKEALLFYKSEIKDTFDIKIILIDDGSTDGTSHWVSENYPEVKILKGDGSLFWSAAINMGIEYALKIPNISHVLFWNKDLYIEKDYLIQLHEHILKVDENVILASKLMRKNEPDTLFSFGGTYDPKTDKKINIGSGKKDGKEFSERKQVDWCGGMAVVMPKEVFVIIGLCDSKNFPQYDGDCDFFLRAKKANFNLHIIPNLKAWNIHENTGRKEGYNFKNYLWYLNDVRSFINVKISYKFLKKHSSGYLPFVYFTLRYTKFTFNYIRKGVISMFKV